MQSYFKYLKTQELGEGNLIWVITQLPYAPSETGDRQMVEPLVWSAQLAPSLVQESTVLTLDLKAETEISAWLTSAEGHTVQWIFSQKTLSEGQHEFPLQGVDWPAGVYRIVVQTDTARKVLSLAKL